MKQSRDRLSEGIGLLVGLDVSYLMIKLHIFIRNQGSQGNLRKVIWANNNDSFKHAVV